MSFEHCLLFIFYLGWNVFQSIQAFVKNSFDEVDKIILALIYKSALISKLCLKKVILKSSCANINCVSIKINSSVRIMPRSFANKLDIYPHVCVLCYLCVKVSTTPPHHYHPPPLPFQVFLYLCATVNKHH